MNKILFYFSKATQPILPPHCPHFLRDCKDKTTLLFNKRFSKSNLREYRYMLNKPLDTKVINNEISTWIIHELIRLRGDAGTGTAKCIKSTFPRIRCGVSILKRFFSRSSFWMTVRKRMHVTQRATARRVSYLDWAIRG